MPSCRRPAWSTIIWSIAAVTRLAGPWPASSSCERERAAAGLAADAVGTAARPHRSFAARRRDRGHRPRAGAGGALERSDERPRDLLRRATFAVGGGAIRGLRYPPLWQGASGGAAAWRPRICDRRHDLAVQGGGRRRLQAG